MAKRGRPSTYTPEIAAEICERLAAGESLLHICEDDHLPAESTIRSWEVQDKPPGFAAEYSRARDLGMDALGEIALKDATREMMPEEVPAAQLAWRARTWHMGKMRPKRYGERQAVELGGPGGSELKVTIRSVLDDE